ncbi:calcium-activated potassium channel subunit beta-4-like isoform X1 [Brienomyrus brachyistius]|uniref:calcium-activated potassium channel subunit beta-4-like isoform X1 n=1 Tax=Brienomyrus brachyistius TaxID=42636 RepID=UPI0020B3DF2F|nr:calcium-activated potassium channel subunit beta-4-like isoform X1 [Brienomyrus brachyistius]XP_048863042.1 calcium-activated potassium channel subunit beta-4-like isoform X1 [Brienomyrus brachyistius]
MAKSRVSHEYTDAEDKSIRLGVVLIASGVLSFFIVLFCWLNPILQSMQSTPANCTVVSVKRPGEMFECVFTCGPDCRGTSLYPCLQVFVNNSQSDSLALLHYDEQQLLGNPKCSYVPPCERDDQKNSERVLLWQDYWTKEVQSRIFTCFFNQQRRMQLQCRILPQGAAPPHADCCRYQMTHFTRLLKVPMRLVSKHPRQGLIPPSPHLISNPFVICTYICSCYILLRYLQYALPSIIFWFYLSTRKLLLPSLLASGRSSWYPDARASSAPE